MMENSVYSVASPEASATILWHDATKAPEAAEKMKITAPDLLEFGIVDRIVAEPPDGAHADAETAIRSVGTCIQATLEELDAFYRTDRGYDRDRLLTARAEKYRRIGVWHGGPSTVDREAYSDVAEA